MPKRSAGILLYRRLEGVVQVLLVHPGGPFWRNKDVGAWQIPKGEIEADEAPLRAALREVAEEIGVAVAGTPCPLGTIRQAGGKIVEAFLAKQDVDVAAIRSITFEMEWPPRSGKRAAFPEVDSARWLGLDEAEAVILASQRPLIDAARRLLEKNQARHHS
ncbi:NUDIX domain-containing protein [Sphingomonas xinjiangensis]|uniref:Putative NUDIX family NTP pyrophosphohydrolase n=1 Tax=Sphingomonas xinjiangensis TaxID=643568 RepID=A0A840YIJ4_9SPHN|nr:NUDIX domain-containing protein [Sphingomonas xinjiangensis]MBB5712265.1 putative NUDIX family NTP pyrophosphohydrolase [Sphingomonas xinjiangensis]